MWHNLLISYLGGKTFLILFSVMFLTDSVKIHVVVYMKKKPATLSGHC